jgi:type I restriction enzyme S subunit
MSITVSEQLPLLAAAPNGIRKLRELILELAVRGKLVAQDASDEPASELLKRIAAEKKRLVAEGKIKQPKSLVEIAAKEEPFELPKGWKWSSLAEVALINPRNAAEDALAVSFVPMTLIGTNFDGVHAQEPRLWGEVKQGFTHFAEGDIGVAKITPCFENSKACVFSGLTNGLGAGTTELHIVRPLPGTIDAKYVLAYAKSPQFLRVGETRMTGTAGQKRLPKDFVETNPFPVPPLAEQHRIVAKVDELMALCDRLEAQQADAESAHAQLVTALLGSLTQASDSDDFAASWQRLSAHFHTLFTTESSIDALNQTLLQLAVMGKLVPQDSNDEPASELLLRMRQTRSDLLHSELEVDPECRTMFKKLAALGDATSPFPLPSSWRVAHLLDCCQRLVDCHNKTAPYSSSGIPIIRTSNVRDREFRFDDLKYVSEEVYEFWSRRCYPKPDDIIFTREAPMGEAAIIPDDAKFCLGQRTMLVRPMHDFIDNKYLLVALTEPHLLERAASAAIGSTVKHLRVGDVERLSIPIPPLAEQHRIVAKVDQLMALCDKLTAAIQRRNQHSRHLADALVDKALSSVSRTSVNVVDLSCYLVDRLVAKPTFGRTTHMKLIYLADTHLGFDFQGEYVREAAGPLDKNIYQVEKQAEANGWYTHTLAPLKSGVEKVTYHATDALAAKARQVAEELGDGRQDLDKLIALLGDKKTDDVQIIATLFAAWNDALLDGDSPSDDWIIREVRENWHVEKLRFTPDQLRHWLDWMRKNSLVPTGKPPRTQHQEKLL